MTQKHKTAKYSKMKIYFSSSISGSSEFGMGKEFSWKLVQWLIENGADVLSEHVAARDQQELDSIFKKRTGVDRKRIKKPWIAARVIDFDWVAKADFLIAVIAGPSLGVGMEIQYALLKQQLGMNPTPILCLVPKKYLKKLSWMVRGQTAPHFKLATFTTLRGAKGIVTKFLQANRKVE